MTRERDNEEEITDFLSSPQVHQIRHTLNQLASPNKCQYQEPTESHCDSEVILVGSPQPSVGRSRSSSSLHNSAIKLSSNADKTRTHELFLKRLNSFTLINWTGKPLCLSPPLFAQYGWQCIGVDTIKCSVCGATAICRLPWPNAGNYRWKIVESCNHIINGHEDMCPWPNNPCSNSFLALYDSSVITLQEKEIALRDFTKRLLDLKTLLNQLPYVHSEIVSELNVSEDCLVELFDIYSVKSPLQFNSSPKSISSSKLTPTHSRRLSLLSPTNLARHQSSTRRKSFSPTRRPSLSPKSHTSPTREQSPARNNSKSPTSPTSPRRKKARAVSTDDENIINHSIKVSCVMLALFGWDCKKNDSQNKDHYICCKLTNRTIGLWNFYSIKDYIDSLKDGKGLSIDWENREPPPKRLRSTATKHKVGKSESKCYFHPSKQNFDWSPWSVVLTQPIIERSLQEFEQPAKPDAVCSADPGWKTLFNILLEHAGINHECQTLANDSVDDLSSKQNGKSNDKRYKLVVDHARRLLDDL